MDTTVYGPSVIAEAAASVGARPQAFVEGRSDQPLSEHGFAYGLKPETCQFSTNVSCEPHGEGKEAYLCPSTDRVRFRLLPSTVWAGREYGLDWLPTRLDFPFFAFMIRNSWEESYP